MALLRMTVVALVACSAADAGPAQGREPVAPAPVRRDPAVHPAGWKRLPGIATAVGAAARGEGVGGPGGSEGVVIDEVDAWGEPAIGCYAVWLALHGREGDAAVLARQVLDGLAGVAGVSRLGARPGDARARGTRPEEPIAITEIAMPTGPQGELAFAFARPPYRGRVRAQLGAGRIAMTACFANQREPGACDAPCASVLRGVP
jgi:hypothetical protein